MEIHVITKWSCKNCEIPVKFWNFSKKYTSYGNQQVSINQLYFQRLITENNNIRCKGYYNFFLWNIKILCMNGVKNNEVIYLIFLINLDFFIYIDKIDLPAIHCFVFKIILSQNVCSNSSIIQILMFRYFMKMLHSKMRLQEKNVAVVVHFFLISEGIEKKCPTFIEQGLFWSHFCLFYHYIVYM